MPHTRRFFQVDLNALVPLNPDLTTTMMYNQLQQKFVSLVEQFRKEIDLQEYGSIILEGRKNQFKVIIVNYEEVLEKKILKLLDFIVRHTIPVVYGNPNKYMSRWRSSGI